MNSSTKSYKSYFRADIDAMSGYAPGEQPKVTNLIKLNTNENPYPPAPGVTELLRNFDPARLRLYPEPLGDSLRDVIAELNQVERDNVIIGNGSDDILTITIRSFSDSKLKIACVDPTYSLYEVLAGIQGAECVKVPLNDDFSMPDNICDQIAGANLLLIPCPNAPTGNAFPLEMMEKICTEFDGIVLIDEAYADFAEYNCMHLATKYPNVIVSRTMSKSYALAGVRLGYAVASKEIIGGMMKVKDSYNVNMLTQQIAIAAFKDQTYLRQTVATIKATRAHLAAELDKLGFTIMPSETNFLFVSPPDGNAALYFEQLRKNNIIVRYFSGERTSKFVRISVGTNEEINRLLAVTQESYG